ncbi:hypothetical protein LDD39_05200 [Lactobacillus delbrueckii subsp. delbrueckii]|nr:hypothetical protein LDD39_05200 [Lactobacillus delbrueckii subsp. delbrueckii]
MYATHCGAKLDKKQESLQISCNGKADGDKEQEEQKDALSQLEIFLSLANIAASFIEQVEGKNRQQGQGEGGTARLWQNPLPK